MSALLAEQIVKGLMHLGMIVSLDPHGQVKIHGLTRNLTDDLRQEITRHKLEVVQYLTESPLVTPAMLVATDLEWWLTDEPHVWADKVTIDAKVFLRLTPAIFFWLKSQVLKAEVACARKKISLDAFCAIVDAFSPVYEYAVTVGLVPDPVIGRQVGVSTPSAQRDRVNALRERRLAV